MGNLLTYATPVCTPMPTPGWPGGEYNYLFAGDGDGHGLAIDVNISAMNASNPEAMPVWTWNQFTSTWTNITHTYPMSASEIADVANRGPAEGMVWDSTANVFLLLTTQSNNAEILQTFAFQPLVGWFNLTATIHFQHLSGGNPAGLVYDAQLGHIYALMENGYGGYYTQWWWYYWSGTAWVNDTTASGINTVGMGGGTPYPVLAYDPSSHSVIALNYQAVNASEEWLTFAFNSSGAWNNVTTLGLPQSWPPAGNGAREPDPVSVTANGGAFYVGNANAYSGPYANILMQPFMWEYKSGWVNVTPTMHNPPPCGVDLNTNGQMPESTGIASMAPELVAEFGGASNGVLLGTGNATCHTASSLKPTDLETINLTGLVPPPPPVQPSLTISNVTGNSFTESWSNGTWTNVSGTRLVIANSSAACQANSANSASWTYNATVFATLWIAQSGGLVNYEYNSSALANLSFHMGETVYVGLWYAYHHGDYAQITTCQVVTFLVPPPPPVFPDIFPFIAFTVVAGMIVFVITRRKYRDEVWK